MNTFFQRHVLSRLWLTFIALGLSFCAFGWGTVNLGRLLIANTQLLHDHGWQAVMDGALAQLCELVLTGYFSMAAYVVFKTCEHRLSDWLGHGRPPLPVRTPSDGSPSSRCQRRLSRCHGTCRRACARGIQ